MSRDVASRAVKGSVYTVGSAVITSALGLVRVVLVARLLPPEVFGLAALAGFFNGLANQLRALGLEDAVVQRSVLTREALATYVTLRMGFLAGSLILLVIFLPFIGSYYPDAPGLAGVILGIAAISLLRGLNAVQEAMLTRNLAFDALMRANLAGSISMTIAAPVLAWLGAGVWSLIGGDLAGQVARGAVVWGTGRAWWPRLGWDTAAARAYWRFGLRLWTDHNLNFVLERFGVFWIGTFLGPAALGLYSRAVEMTGYSGRLIVIPLRTVVFATLARVQDDRLRLSQAFVRANGLVLRANVWASVVLVITAPEMVPLLLGPGWAAMITAFQLMVVYAIFDPLARGGRDVLIAAGQVGAVVRVRAIQCGMFIPAVIVLSGAWGIAGAAVAADLMMVTGTVLVLRRARALVDYSAPRLFVWPAVSALLALLAVHVAAPLWDGASVWGVLAGKTVIAGAVYPLILLAAERGQLIASARQALRLWRASV